jgi:hypothetical protein
MHDGLPGAGRLLSIWPLLQSPGSYPEACFYIRAVLSVGHAQASKLCWFVIQFA